MNKKTTIYIIFILIISSLPFILGVQRSTMTLINTIVIYSIAALGFNILLGYSGQISLGHAAFMGLGAYISAYVTNTLPEMGGVEFIIGIFLAGLIPLVIGLILGLIALRLEGHYLAIATLGFGVAIQQVFKEWVAFTNGFSGMNASAINLFGTSLRSRESFYIFSLIILALLSIFSYNFIHSKIGRGLIAMRDSEHAAQAMGISIFKYKLIAFSVSAFYTGIAGGLYVHLIRFVEPNQWGVELSLNLLAMVVIGGLASIFGSILGAAFLTAIPEILKEIPVIGEIRNLSMILTGVLLIVVIMFMPQGIARLGIKIKFLFNKKTKEEKLKEEKVV
ncbi:branched-chain amino acid ABC transporter permease [Senegalia massiliensis]|uniref:Branched-chain amino acid ABC transporter permease n=1 Tax=Senegalia massiliensis TaxID=1720316 RepID=A0A845QYB4_9CLOT|nr:branched-chain amino acid ABC transporter permease [Senegalia massiliensis]